MAIITDRFIATHKPAQKLRDFIWRFYARGRSEAWPYYEIEFDAHNREFKGWRTETFGYGKSQRTLSEKDIAKLRGMLCPADIAACTAAALKVPL
ncbi:hypothetical protein NKJ72_12130 [Mesorhizobium sp. M0045]|uniref:hypothetical protein n=1 Tax=Mesorhizobium sp. M0045 TaxID=2956857 RepID=UPI003338D3FC